MQYILTEQEYSILKGNSKALEEINRIINEKPENDEHGNSIPYSYRFDKTISRIMDVLDTVKVTEIGDVWKMPWFRDTDQMLKGLNIR